MTRTGAEALVEALAAAGTTVVFGNPGTTEQAFLDALGKVPAIEYVTALHEGVAVGAAEGYSRASGGVGVVQLHTGCGFGNASGMIANANVGHTPMVVVVGSASRRGVHTEPALGGDIVAMAGPIAKWAWEFRTADEVPAVVARAFKVAASAPAGPVVLALPIDVADEPCAVAAMAPSWVDEMVVPSPAAIDAVVTALRDARSPCFVVGDGLGGAAAGASLAQLAETVGAPIHSAYTADSALPVDHPLDMGELPLFDVAGARGRLAQHDLVVAFGADVLRAVFPEAGAPLGDTEVIHIGLDAWQLGKSQPARTVLGHVGATIDALSAALGPSAVDGAAERLAAQVAAVAARPPVAPPTTTGFDADVVLAALGAVMPDDAIVVDESVSAMPALARRVRRRPGQWFRSRGGGLGAGMSLPLGIATARPDVRTVAVVGDGAAMYTITGLWVAGRQRLPITWVVVDNGGYRILEANTRVWRGPGGDDDFVGTSLRDPAIDIAGLATAFGVRAWTVRTVEEATAAFADALDGGPTLIHARLG